MNILADATLPGLEAAFPLPFILTLYNKPEEIPFLLDKQDILLCRSTLKVNHHLLKDHQLKYVATASSGTDHIDHAYLKNNNIKLIDAKGSNATSVADYVVSTLAYLEQKHLLNGKKAGIIGMGAVGSKVYRRLNALNFQIHTYDPLKADDDTAFQSCELEDLFDCDLLCIHAELHSTKPHPSNNLIDQNFLNQLKSGCILINASRGGIVNEEALASSQNELIYCTDVYLNEPKIDHRIIKKATLCTPHIAGHSMEAKYGAVALISQQIHKIMNIPEPVYAQPDLSTEITCDEHQSWHELVLSLYNPVIETRILKDAPNKELAFLRLRKQHQHRHNFSLYIDLMHQNFPSVYNAITES
ncbi:4-phosphoerythronate dehydrogenase [Legionella bononiensis]|uniref:4-phosphoerythronate dehydrogenase n=1 Tax=Legionella bononiensis TaxID=2793102 RepID=A0ABS1W8E5_9GAMM|nr:4-phosphoerythronate dehydrogenase [Legionella bononiensis]MBL7479845.1 4-phosphoerythronate dehydrogenase [Legionella bononiensis]MBL7525640.1 4-phosphoerythronate dehydrogenase [Legionella bononiensis]MBL7561823.1 4-phosphoerythronate dehydrogenase [Legionella bononiensis]